MTFTPRAVPCLRAGREKRGEGRGERVERVMVVKKWRSAREKAKRGAGEGKEGKWKEKGA